MKKFNQNIKNNFGLFIAIATICVVLPYASNATIISLAVATIGKHPFAKLIKYFQQHFINLNVVSFFMIILLGFFSCFWAINPSVSFNLAIRLLALGLLFMFNLLVIENIPQETAKKAQKFAIYAIIITLAFYMIDIVTNGELASLIKGTPQLNLTRIGRGAAVLSVMMMPVAVMIYNQKRNFFLAALFVIACSSIIIILPMRSSLISVFLGILTFGFVYYFKKTAVILVFGLMILITILMPVLSLNFVNLKTTANYSHIIPSSWRHRLVIWNYCSELIIKKPLYGYGLENARELGKNAPRRLITTPQNSEHPQSDFALPLHPHNMAIQIWLELGFLGVIAFCCLFWRIMKITLSKLNDKKIAATACAMSVSAFFIASFSFGVWQNWWLSGLFLSIMLLKILERTPNNINPD